MNSKTGHTPRITPSKTERTTVKSDKKVTPTTKSPLKLRNLCSVTPNSKTTHTKTEMNETNAQMEARIRCQLRLEMLVRMREMQDYYESKIADLTEQMDSDSPTLSAIRDANNQMDIEAQKNQAQIETLKQQIEEMKKNNLELEKKLQEQKERNIQSSKEIENAQIFNSKLTEQKNSLQMRVDALKKKRQEDELRENAEREEKLRRELLEKEMQEQEAKTQEEQKKETKSVKTPRSQMKHDVAKASKRGKENMNASQNPAQSSLKGSSFKNESTKSRHNSNNSNNGSSQPNRKIDNAPIGAAGGSSGMSELSKPPYRMKITPHLAHKAKHAK